MDLVAFLPSTSFHYPEGTITRFRNGLVEWIDPEQAELLSSKSLGVVSETTPRPHDYDFRRCKIVEEDNNLAVVGDNFRSPLFPRQSVEYGSGGAMWEILCWLRREQGIANATSYVMSALYELFLTSNPPELPAAD